MQENAAWRARAVRTGCLKVFLQLVDAGLERLARLHMLLMHHAACVLDELVSALCRLAEHKDEALKIQALAAAARLSCRCLCCLLGLAA